MKLNVLKGKLVEKGLTYEECANALNITVTTFSKKMNEQSKFLVTEANALAKFLDLSEEEKIYIFLS